MAKNKTTTTKSAGLGEGNVKEVVSKKKTFHPELDTTDEAILESISEGDEIAWDYKKLPILTEETFENLPYKVAVAYKAAQKERDKIPEGFEVLGTLSTSAERKLALRERRGWHQTWKRPDQFDDALEVGYIAIREPTKDKNGNFLKEKPGEEGGQIKKLGPRDTPELIAVEINQARKDAHDRAVSRKSKRAYVANKEGFRTVVEEVNSNLGSRKDKVVVVDDEED